MPLPKDKMVLQGTNNRLNESGRCYGMENNHPQYGYERSKTTIECNI